MTRTAGACIAKHFETLSDPRRRKVVYPLMNIVVMALCAVLSGADDFTGIADWARTKRSWLSRFLDMSSGIPSHDRFNAIFAALNPAEFERCLLSWIQDLHEITGGQVIAIDGKTLRGSFDAASSKAAIHMIGAWATANHVCLGQRVVDGVSNEASAVPKLLEMLDVSGCLVTLDAAGCRPEIAAKIVTGGGDYVLTVKKNQRKLHEAIDAFFSEHLENELQSVAHRKHETRERGHGRVDDRYYYLAKIPRDFPLAAQWPGLKGIGMAVRVTEHADGRASDQTRYYITSSYMGGAKFAQAVRGHWGIENGLHWQLDVAFGEDACRVRKGNADVNLGLIRRAALSLLKNNRTRKLGVKNKRLSAGWDDDYRLEVILGASQTQENTPLMVQ